MATIYRKRTTRPLPAEAVLLTGQGQQFARWTDAKGQTRTAAVTRGTGGAERIVTIAATWTAKYRDGEGVVREVATGCRDKQAAQSILSDFERRAELVKANVIKPAEDAIADHQPTQLPKHIDACLVHLESRQTSAHHRVNVRGCLERIAAECVFTRLSDLDAGPLECWLLTAEKAGMGARTRNRHLSALSAFANWCVNTRRLVGNPVAGVAKANERADRRRQRRAMTEAELVKLLAEARRRPVLDAMTIRRGKRKWQAAAELKPATRKRLERFGR